MHADLEGIACYLAKCPFDTTCLDALTARNIWIGLHEASASAAASARSLKR